MKTFREFIKEVYDPDVVGKSQIRKQGEGGRVGRMRKQSEPEKRRMKAVGGGKMVPAKTYKDRKDIGTQRKTSDRQQQPTQARGSAALSPREQQAKARRERMAARSGATKVKSKEDVKVAEPPLEEIKEKPKKRRKKKIEEVKPDILASELAKLEAIKEEDLTEEQEDRLMELRRIKTQRLMHQEADDQFQSEMKQADDEIKTLKSQLKIKDPLPKGYVE